MVRVYSFDRCDRVVATIMVSGLSWQSAARRGVAVSPTIKWVDCYKATSSATPSTMGGHKSKTIAGGHADWLRQRCRERACTLRQLVHELASERAFKVDDRSV